MNILDILRRAARGENRTGGDWDTANPGAFTFAAGQARGPKKPIPGLKAGAGGNVQQRDFGAPRGEVSVPVDVRWSTASEPIYTRKDAQGAAAPRGIALPIADARAAALRGREPVPEPATVAPLDYSQFTVPEGTPLDDEMVSGETQSPGVSYSAPAEPGRLAVQGSAQHQGGPLSPELSYQNADEEARAAGEAQIERDMAVARGGSAAFPPTPELLSTGTSQNLAQDVFRRVMQQRMMAQALRERNTDALRSLPANPYDWINGG